MLSGTPFHRKLSFLSLFTLIHPYHRQAVVVWQDSATSLQAQTRNAFPLLTKLIDNDSSGSRSSEMGEEWVEKFRVKCLQEFRNSWPTSQPISRACAAEFSQRCTEPSSNRPEFLTWYAISAVSWRDAQSLGRERGDRRVVWVGWEGADGNPGQVIVSRNSVQRPQVAASVSYTSSIKDLIESLSFFVFFSAIISLPPSSRSSSRFRGKRFLR